MRHNLPVLVFCRQHNIRIERNSHISPVVVLFFLILLVIALGACTDGGTVEESVEDSPTESDGSRVEALEVSDSTRTISYSTSGTLSPAVFSTISSEVGGTVKRSPVDAGTRLAEGQVLLTLEDDALVFRRDSVVRELAILRFGYDDEEVVSEIEAGLDQARGCFEVVSANYERMTTLFERGSISQTAYDQATVQFLNAQAGYRNAQAAHSKWGDRVALLELQLTELNRQVALLEVKAPYSGVVVDTLVETGERVSPMQPLMLFQDDTVLKLEVSLPDTFSSWVVPAGASDPNTTRVDIRPRTTRSIVTGLVSHVTPRIDPASRTFAFEVQLRNTESETKGRLCMAESFAEIEVLVEVRSVFIPRRAQYMDGERAMVAVLTRKPDGYEVERRELERGLSSGDVVEVLRGVVSGETVVLNPAALAGQNRVDSASVRISH